MSAVILYRYFGWPHANQGDNRYHQEPAVESKQPTHVEEARVGLGVEVVGRAAEHRQAGEVVRQAEQRHQHLRLKRECMCGQTREWAGPPTMLEKHITENGREEDTVADYQVPGCRSPTRLVMREKKESGKYLDGGAAK